MTVFAGTITDGGILGLAALVFGITSLILGIVQLAMLRRVNLVPAIVGTIAITFFAGMLGESLGRYYLYQSLGGWYVKDRTVMMSLGKKLTMIPTVIALTSCLFSALLGTVAATLRANLKPR
jgi:hypothetical protein